MKCPKCGKDRMTVVIIKGYETINECKECGCRMTDWQQSEITRLRAELDALKARNEDAEKVIENMIPFLKEGIDGLSAYSCVQAYCAKYLRKDGEAEVAHATNQWDRVFGALPDLPEPREGE